MSAENQRGLPGRKSLVLTHTTNPARQAEPMFGCDKNLLLTKVLYDNTESYGLGFSRSVVAHPIPPGQGFGGKTRGESHVRLFSLKPL